jgi:predicted kinase
MKPEIILMVGPPGSGKSYVSKEFEARTYKRISQDDMGKDGHLDEFTNALFANRHIVVDRMNFSKEQRDRYLEPAKRLGYRTRIIVMHVPSDTCYQRCVLRKDHPTIKDSSTASKVIDFFFSKYERVEDSEADVVERRGWDGTKEPAIWCDLDGTLCNIDGRLHHVKTEGKKKDWKAFFQDIPKDKVNEWCRDIIWSFENTTRIVFASGRSDDHRMNTVTWLQDHGVNYHNLFMRRRNDFRQDFIVKEIILEFEVLPQYNIKFAIDDRKQVVDMLRKHGVTVLQCAEGNF